MVGANPHKPEGAPPKVASGTESSRVKKQPFLSVWMKGMFIQHSSDTVKSARVEKK